MDPQRSQVLPGAQPPLLHTPHSVLIVLRRTRHNRPSVTFLTDLIGKRW